MFDKKAYMKIYNKRRYKENKEQVNALCRQYYQDHKELERARTKKYREAHKEQTRIYWKKYNKIHKDETRERGRRWAKTVNGKLSRKVRHSRRRINDKGLSVAIVQRVYEDNIKRYSTLTCYLCKKTIPFGKDHLEHKVPLSRGGNNEYYNLAISCAFCNNSKYTKTEEEYRKEIIADLKLKLEELN